MAEQPPERCCSTRSSCRRGRDNSWVDLSAAYAGLSDRLNGHGVSREFETEFFSGFADSTTAALCCTDQQLGEISPPHRHLFEANVFRPPKLQHTVQRRDSNGHLGRLPPFGP